jgi:hypothetical protein
LVIGPAAIGAVHECGRSQPVGDIRGGGATLIAVELLTVLLSGAAQRGNASRSSLFRTSDGAVRVTDRRFAPAVVPHDARLLYRGAPRSERFRYD